MRKAGANAQYASLDQLQDHTAFIDRSLHQRVDWNQQLAAKAHTKAVNAIRYSPGGTHLISCGNDRMVRLWDAVTGKLHPIRYSECCSSMLKYEIEIAGFSSASGDELLIYPGTDRKPPPPPPSVSDPSDSLREHPLHPAPLLHRKTSENLRRARRPRHWRANAL
jgi:WD40 repeat protein